MNNENQNFNGQDPMMGTMPDANMNAQMGMPEPNMAAPMGMPDANMNPNPMEVDNGMGMTVPEGNSLMTPIDEAPMGMADPNMNQNPMGMPDANMATPQMDTTAMGMPDANMNPAPMGMDNNMQMPDQNQAMPAMQPEDAPTMSQMGADTANAANVPQGEASGAWIALGFFASIIGIILYFVLKTKLPSVSKKCGKGALIGLIVKGAIIILGVVLVSCGIAAVSSAIYY